MEISRTALPGVVVLTPRRFSDDRGWFSETFSYATLTKLGIDLDFVQENHSFSADTGTLRGMHYQAPPQAQDKLVRCSRGAIWDVAVDVRRGSPSFGQWVGVDLTAENGKQLLVPKGYLHGFVTRVPATEVQYMVTDFYAPECDGAVRWDTLGIDWNCHGTPILSEKDATAPAFDAWVSPFIWEDGQ